MPDIAGTGMTGEGLRVTDLDRSRVPEAARLHCRAFATSPSGRLGPYYVEALFRWFLGYDGAVVLAAEDLGGTLVGYAFGARAAYGERLRDDLRTTVAGALLRRPWALCDKVLLETMAGYVRQLRKRRAPAGAGPQAPASVSPHSWSLVAIAVAPSHRRSGVARRLLAEFEDRSREMGATELRLTVTLDNLAARRFYERAAWVAGPERPDATMSYTKHLAVEPNGDGGEGAGRPVSGQGNG